MTSSALLGALRRRWLLVLIGLLMSAGLAATAYLVSKPTYEITATVLLLPPSSSVPPDSNPYLMLGGLRQAVDLVGVALSDENTAHDLQAISRDVQFTAQADPRSSAPILVIDVKDSTAAGAVQIRDLLVQRVPARLDAMQRALSVAPGNRVTATVVTSDNQALEVGRQRLRLAVVALAAGLASTLALTALWDSHRLRRAVPAPPSSAPLGDSAPYPSPPMTSGPGAADPTTGGEPPQPPAPVDKRENDDDGALGDAPGGRRALRTVGDAGRGAVG